MNSADLKLILNKTPAIIFILDFTGKIVWANQITIELLEYPEEAIGKMNVGKLLDPQQLMKMIEDREYILNKGGNSIPRVYFIKKQDGSSLPVEGNATLFSGDDEESMFLCVAWDISQRLALEKQQADLMQELMQTQKIATLGAMLGSSAHESNNHLTGVKYGIDAALRDISSSPGNFDPERIVRLLTISKDAANRIQAFNESILSLSRKDNNTTQALDIKLIIQKITDFYIPLLAKERINIKVLSADNYPLISGNLDQLVTVFLNLLNNSKDALEKIKNALIEISWQAVIIGQEDVPVQFIGAQPGKYLKVTVSDNGSGIEAEMLKKIFEPYITTKAKKGGTGLGLPTVVNIIKLHHGILTCESQVGKGTIFTVFLPSN